MAFLSGLVQASVVMQTVSGPQRPISRDRFQDRKKLCCGVKGRKERKNSKIIYVLITYGQPILICMNKMFACADTRDAKASIIAQANKMS
jgi:hypothetical protein